MNKSVICGDAMPVPCAARTIRLARRAPPIEIGSKIFPNAMSPPQPPHCSRPLVFFVVNIVLTKNSNATLLAYCQKLTIAKTRADSSMLLQCCPSDHDIRFTGGFDATSGLYSALDRYCPLNCFNTPITRADPS